LQAPPLDQPEQRRGFYFIRGPCYHCCPEPCADERGPAPVVLCGRCSLFQLFQLFCCSRFQLFCCSRVDSLLDSLQWLGESWTGLGQRSHD